MEAALLIYKRLAPLLALAIIPLLVLLVIQKGETRHWKKQSAGFEQLYHAEQAAFATTVANYRAAADAARAADRASAERVKAEQSAINERTDHDYETRLADARARAARLQQLAEAAADPRRGGAAAVPAVPAGAGGAAQAAGESGLPAPLSRDDALTATEQAIQLDELIKWVNRQHQVDPNKGTGSQH